MREFIKETTNVGGTVGITIPNWICKAEGIGKFQKVRVLIEPIPEEPIKRTEMPLQHVNPLSLIWTSNQSKNRAKLNAIAFNEVSARDGSLDPDEVLYWGKRREGLEPLREITVE